MFAYLDASVIASLLLNEPCSQKVVEALRPFGRRCIISDFASAEVSSAVAKRVRMGRESAKIANARLLAFDRFKADFPDRATLAPNDVSTAERLVRAFELKLRAPDAIHAAVCDDISNFVASLGWRVLGVIPSPIEGGDGNAEFLIAAARETL